MLAELDSSKSRSPGGKAVSFGGFRVVIVEGFNVQEVSMKLTTAIAVSVLATASVAAISTAFAQEAVSFEVAAIKPAKPLSPAMIASGEYHFTSDDAIFETSSISLLNLITMAYETKAELVSGPGWLQDQNFSVAAKLPAGASRKQTPAMLRHLLAERFRLAVHRDEKIQSAYLLHTATASAKLNTAKETAAPSSCNGVPGHIRCRSVTMVQVANNLSLRATVNAFATPGDGPREIDLPVVDQTGLSGNYDFDLEWNDPRAGGGGRGGAIAPANPNTKALSIFEALEAVGLRLEKGKHPFDFVVIDHVEKVPTEN
jgi:uncharacterized protein (TIGR03435 family)